MMRHLFEGAKVNQGLSKRLARGSFRTERWRSGLKYIVKRASVISPGATGRASTARPRQKHVKIWHAIEFGG